MNRRVDEGFGERPRTPSPRRGKGVEEDPMRSRRKMFVCVGVVLALACLAFAADLQKFPGDFPGPPFYSFEFSSPADGWAAVLFLRDPDSIPSDANLLALDFGAVARPLTVHGYTIRSNPLPAPPDVFHAEGNDDMPVWLLSSADIAAAVADGLLKIGELESASSLVKGTADLFVIHEEVRSDLIQVTSHGDLDDGRRFKAKLSVASGELRARQITVK
jgi:hypothetical protein